MNPGIEDDEINITIDPTALFKDATVDMRYKYWFDNPDVEEAQKAGYEAARSGTPTTRLHLGLFPIYEDSEGASYYISGRTKTHPSGQGDLLSLRDEGTGKLHYLHLTGVTDTSFLTAFYEVLAEENITQPTEFNEYSDNTDLASFDPNVTYKVFVNNLDTKASYNRAQVTMPITKWLKEYNLAALEVEDTSSTLTLNTGAGLVELQFDKYEDSGSEWDKAWKITYTDDTVQVVKNSEIVLNGDVMSFSPEAIQKVLGYSIVVYDDSINIITDNKDLADADSVIPSQIPDNAPVADETTPWNQNAEATNNEETAEPEPEVDTSRMPAPPIDAVKEWTETPASGTYYVNDDGVSSREKPIQGSTRVKSFNTNDTVTVTAITNTGYYKLSDGSFLHQDFTSSTKIDTNPAPAPILEQQPTTTTKPNSGNESSGSGSNSNSGSNSSSSGPGTINSEGYYEVSGGGMKVATSKIGMELDANGLPVDTAKYPQFRDDNGQDWQYAPILGWTKCTFGNGANIGHSDVETSGPG